MNSECFVWVYSYSPLCSGGSRGQKMEQGSPESVVTSDLSNIVGSRDEAGSSSV